MCDFGISGYLVDSVAKTIDAGCKPYMAVSRVESIFLFLCQHIQFLYFLSGASLGLNPSLDGLFFIMTSWTLGSPNSNGNMASLTGDVKAYQAKCLPHVLYCQNNVP